MTPRFQWMEYAYGRCQKERRQCFVVRRWSSVPYMSTMEEIADVGLKILRSRFTPWQRIDAIKTFVYPSVRHLLRMGTFLKTDWETVDNIWRPEFKTTLGVQQESSNEYLYSSRRNSSCGIKLIADESDFAAVDCTFKLFTHIYE